MLYEFIDIGSKDDFLDFLLFKIGSMIVIGGLRFECIKVFVE